MIKNVINFIKQTTGYWLLVTGSFILLLAACSGKDPILPGERHAIFSTVGITMLDKPVPENALAEIRQPGPHNAEYQQDSSNVIWRESKDGRVRIFSGFPTPAHVSGERRPVVTDKYLFAGLSTGEVVKVDRNTRELVWVANIFRASAPTGGSSILDIVAPVIVDGDRFVYAGGLGNAFCKLNAANGTRVWCNGLGIGTPFIVRTGVSYAVATDGHLYAIDNATGNAFWRAEVRRQQTPKLVQNMITVGREKFDAKTGERQR
jgi:outer membrane protein assembly factor BamB